jgi:hypothetical protein
MGRPSSWTFWLACAFTLGLALLGFWLTIRGPDLNDLFRGTCLLLLASLTALTLAYYALRSLRQIPPAQVPDTEQP